GGIKEQKMYEEYLKKLDDNNAERVKKNAEYVLKTYRQDLTERAQLDAWYIEEKAEIYAKDKSGKSIFSDEEQKKLLYNLNSKYAKKADDVTYKEFRSSQMFEDMQNNIDTLNNKYISNMLKRINELKSSMTNLDLTQLKEINNLIQKLREKSFEIDIFKGWKDVKKRLKEAKEAYGFAEAEGKNINDLREEQSINEENLRMNQEKLSLIERIDAIKQKTINTETQQNVLTKEEQELLDNNKELAGKISIELLAEEEKTRRTIEAIKKKLCITQEYIDAKNEEYTSWEKTEAQVKAVQEKEKQLYQVTRELLELMGVSEEDLLWGDLASTILDSVFNTILFIIQLKTASANAAILGTAMKTALGIIGAVIIALETIVAVWSAFNKAHDARLEKKIKALQEQIDGLKDSLEDLQQSFEDAFDTGILSNYRNAMETNIRNQIKAIEQQMAAERAKKKTDQDKLNDYSKSIKELRDQLEELAVSTTEALGGIGSESNYKSAAQGFADAWYDAFKEGEDGLDALNEKFDEVFDNLVKKQIMNRASLNFIKPILDQVDKAVAQDSEGGYDVTSAELAKIQALKDQNLQGYNNYVNALMDMLGVTPDGTNLSALQQGIQGVSEETAGVLEGIMESMRYYLATQQGDVSAIRMILENQYGSATTDSPMLT
ncbi:MAG: hypothetical protein HUK07_05995, partial [Bacteroidaceae bacterium]|nr:hypothetical protein [Bacteroidaceae bacterium]